MSNKPKELRRASKVCWALSWLTTANFIHAVVSANMENAILALLLAGGVSFGLQYIFTLVESALFDSTLPPPWKIDWKAGGPLPWLQCGAVLCLFVDVLFNFGGVSYFMSKLGDNTDLKTLSLDLAVIQVIEVTITFLLSVLIAVGSELLNEFANYLENPSSTGNKPKRNLDEAINNRGRLP